jgi:hypothetical protein
MLKFCGLVSLASCIIPVAAASPRPLCMACPAPERLRHLLQSEMDGTRESDMPILLPCCYDGLTARLVARAGFDATFMTGFGVSGTSLRQKPPVWRKSLLFSRMDYHL